LTLAGGAHHAHADGMTAGGIDGSPADLSEQKLREMYLSPWQYLADGRGLRSVMAAQNMVNGRPMHCNKRLLTDVLRTEWGVTDCLVESDGGDVIGALQGFHVGGKQITPHQDGDHWVRGSREDVAVMSLEAGMDMDLGGSAFDYSVLGPAVLSNRTSMAMIDRAVYRVLVSKFASGIFDHPYTDESRVQSLDRAEHRVMAREMAEESIVLLINHNQTLPIKDIRTKKIALVGWLADSEFDHCGSYFNAGANVVTVKAAMQAAGIQMTYRLAHRQGAALFMIQAGSLLCYIGVLQLYASYSHRLWALVATIEPSQPRPIIRLLFSILVVLPAPFCLSYTVATCARQVPIPAGVPCAPSIIVVVLEVKRISLC
jgi:beta-glucosidase-like glycosyl hydrolase